MAFTISQLLNNSYQGDTGFTGSQGETGFVGSIGFTGSVGAGLDLANNDSATTHFLVFVEGSGVQSGRISNSGNILSFVPSTGELSSVDFNSTSDISLKENIVKVDNALEKVLSMNGVTFNFKNSDGKKRLGVLAQEVEEILPEVVSMNSEGFKTVSYGSIVGLLIEAIKDLKNEIEDLKKK